MLSFRSATLYVGTMMAVKSLAGLAALKVQASVLLPGGFAVLSQFITVTGLVTTVSSAAITTGMTVLLSKATSPLRRFQLIRSGEAFSVGIAFLASSACLIPFFLGPEAVGVSPLPRYLFLLLALAPWLITRSSIVQARLTSSLHLNRFAKLSNSAVVAVALMTIAMTLLFELNGSAIAVAIGPMLTASILLVFASDKTPPSSHRPGKQSDARETNRFQDIRELLRFSAVILVASCAVPIAQLLIRNAMMSNGQLDQAGYWSSGLRLSDAYMQFFGLLMMSYILPRVSALTEAPQTRRLFSRYLCYVAIIGAGVLGFVYLLREPIVMLALSAEFSPTIDLLPAQLLGDFFRVVLSFFFWFAYGQNLRMLAASEEIVQALLFYSFFMLLDDGHDSLRAVQAHLIASSTNAAVMGLCLSIVLLRRR